MGYGGTILIPWSPHGELLRTYTGISMKWQQIKLFFGIPVPYQNKCKITTVTTNTVGFTNHTWHITFTGLMTIWMFDVTAVLWFLLCIICMECINGRSHLSVYPSCPPLKLLHPSLPSPPCYISTLFTVFQWNVLYEVCIKSCHINLILVHVNQM
jgi:hypothetical protein